MSAVEIHCELCAVYCQNVMSEGTVRQWCRMVKDGRANSYSRRRAKWSAICFEWLYFSKCYPKIFWKMTLYNFRIFMWISTDFTHSSLRDYHRLDYHKFCARWVPKMLTGTHKTQRMASAFVDFFRSIPQRWWWISQSHPRSNRWWNLGFNCQCWNRRAVIAVDAHTLTTEAKKVQTNVVC
jgi:hypothetical protein